MLSIVIVTMNRAEQLKEALESCFQCLLLEDTEIVIVDNASKDNTRQVVEELKGRHSEVNIRYIYSNSNLGVGGGRNLGFDNASGRYLYFMDDDAIIAPECARDFFVTTIAYLEEHTEVASLTTKISDEIMGDQRNEIVSSHVHGSKRLMFFFLGGSHFLRKASFDSPLYLDIEYGAEEYAPSILAINRGYCHVFDDSIRIIHKPKVNKWIDGSERMRKIQIANAAVVYATKKMLYPRFFHPVLWFCYQIRCMRYLSGYKGAKSVAAKLVKNIVRNNSLPRVEAKTVLKMYILFGYTVF